MPTTVSSVQAAWLILDLGGVKKISSFGIREWVDFMATAAKQCGQIILIEAAPKVVDQLNMVANFAASGRVFSFYAPCRCDYCDSEQRVLLEVAKDYEAIKAMKKRGLKVHPVSPELQEEWRRFAEAVYPQMRGSMVPADMFDEVLNLVREYRVSGGGAKS